jgi:hypothetical protein
VRRPNFNKKSDVLNHWHASMNLTVRRVWEEDFAPSHSGPRGPDAFQAPSPSDHRSTTVNCFVRMTCNQRGGCPVLALCLPAAGGRAGLGFSSLSSSVVFLLSAISQKTNHLPYTT